MWLKTIIVLLFLAVLASLTSALLFLLRDMGAPESKRTLYALGIRITLAALLLLTIWYGFHSGMLSNTAPWANKY
ncbi:DUF2909 domain-containing protein [Microbulbifer sp. YPW1]|uniref:DUF2909 domain-containing protein n=1 Tax=unclassified Microbulbifer TaxID=2619833 RepID=UPI001597D2F5|nr:DUF2909 domain-containing protein [Microbulbifer sp. YPW1]QKX16627.1 DUF2909 domain-containing protein [Microbulbifer sp. YPW1]